jgi:two-component system, chemotaxis family, CheB/CheR fusion protein
MQPDTSQSSVIVADDSSLIRDVLRSNLAGAFGHVHLATDGLEAVEAARGLQASLVILDYRMARLNGVEAAREIRELPGYAKVPIVLLTAYDDEKLRRDAARVGVTLVFPKPVIYEQLMEKLMPFLAAGRETAPVLAADGLARGRDLLNQRRRIEAETDNAKRRYTGLADRTSPFLGSWRR